MPAGTRVVLRVTLEVHDPLTDPVFGFVVKQLGGFGGHTVYTTNSLLLGARTGAFAGGARTEVRFPFTAALMNGQYSVQVAAADAAGTLLDWVNDFLTFTVEGSACWEGVADLMAGFQCGPAAAGDGTEDGPAAEPRDS